MSRPKSSARKSQIPEHRMIIDIQNCAFSYFACCHSSERPRHTTEEGIITLLGSIVEIDPPQPEHIGQAIECAFTFERSLRDDRVGDSDSRLGLFSIQLSRTTRSLFAYVPEGLLWGLQARCEAGATTRIEATYLKPFRGHGDVTSYSFTGPAFPVPNSRPVNSGQLVQSGIQ
ncbi:hypothetical protein LUI11_33465 [Bradyrhizobium diazoefficiens]|jgi:hypothetical protein|uniref:hypothetical protein n=1 Tax=Bradyrhizobium TaxID=374 RepID=UPI000457081B|nr:hypothetical protein [Bradyrhizobium diazoefficiens]APO56885.1 hypothetical protein BD122_41370 [Bradyrhizobium diazoefficiens]MCD9296375.1 hypothetical protein [Bradyrhizobium diazoefficiens]MCD9814931.1 hypothetical protein [Bradyrhizobium diazoefficiens]MCD9833056.1 hypothetical protein [Bradyrhizobium diazoefficiens]MCD9851737.1 hypothetical protein [Bradyrhizobium diazoefficiens]